MWAFLIFGHRYKLQAKEYCAEPGYCSSNVCVLVQLDGMINSRLLRCAEHKRIEGAPIENKKVDVQKNKLLLDLSLMITWTILNRDESDPYCGFDESTKGAK